jgi:hypothetical protein
MSEVQFFLLSVESKKSASGVVLDVTQCSIGRAAYFAGALWHYACSSQGIFICSSMFGHMNLHCMARFVVTNKGGFGFCARITDNIMYQRCESGGERLH